MKEYKFDEIETGMRESFCVTVSQNMVDMFKEITGDINPLHLDKEYAVSKGYRQPVVYGMLTASFFSRLGGAYLPGKYCLFYENDVIFNKPVFVGDELTVSGKVVEKKNVPFNHIIVKGVITNQENETVSRARLVLGVTE